MVAEGADTFFVVGFCPSSIGFKLYTVDNELQH